MKYFILLALIAFPHYGFITYEIETLNSLRITPASCEQVTIKEKETLSVIDFNASNRVTRARVYTDEDGDAEFNYDYDKNGAPFLVKAGNRAEKEDDNAPGKSKGFKAVEVKGNNTYNLVGGMDEEESNTFRIVNGKLVEWMFKRGDSEADNKYTYDKNGNMQSLIQDGHNEGAVSHLEMQATYDLTKTSICRSDPSLAIMEVAWSQFPMTNTNLMTGFTYHQTIKTEGKTIPISKTATLQYAFDSKGRPKTLTVTSAKGGIPKNYAIEYKAIPCK